MKRALVALAIILALAGCATTHVLDAPIPTSPASLPSISAALDPDRAEVALYIGMKFVEAAVIQMNILHSKGLMAEQTYSALVAAPDSIARKLQRDASDVSSGIDLWRKTQTKPIWFDASATNLQTLIGKIAEGVQ